MRFETNNCVVRYSRPTETLAPEETLPTLSLDVPAVFSVFSIRTVSRAT